MVSQNEIAILGVYTTFKHTNTYIYIYNYIYIYILYIYVLYIYVHGNTTRPSRALSGWSIIAPRSSFQVQNLLGSQSWDLINWEFCSCKMWIYICFWPYLINEYWICWYLLDILRRWLVTTRYNLQKWCSTLMQSQRVFQCTQLLIRHSWIWVNSKIYQIYHSPEFFDQMISLLITNHY